MTLSFDHERIECRVCKGTGENPHATEAMRLALAKHGFVDRGCVACDGFGSFEPNDPRIQLQEHGA